MTLQYIQQNRNLKRQRHAITINVRHYEVSSCWSKHQIVWIKSLTVIIKRKRLSNTFSILCVSTVYDAVHGGSNFYKGTQRPNVSRYARSAWNGFLYALEACLVNLELPWNQSICWDVSGVLRFSVAFSSRPKLLATMIGPVESLRTWSSRNNRGQLSLYQNFQDIFLAIIA